MGASKLARTGHAHPALGGPLKYLPVRVIPPVNVLTPFGQRTWLVCAGGPGRAGHVSRRRCSQLSGGVQGFVRFMPAARPLPEITSAIFRDASSIISSPIIAAPRFPPASEVQYA